MVEAFVLRRGSMKPGGRGEPGDRGEGGAGLVAGKLTGRLIGMAIGIHKTLGPGLFEQFYEDCFTLELSCSGLRFARQVVLPGVYEGVRFDRGYRADLIIEGTVLIEIKSVDAILPIHENQLLTYLYLSDCRVGLLLNFKTTLLKNGIRRFVHTPSPRPPESPCPPR
jgi:GxxExxY protein